MEATNFYQYAAFVVGSNALALVMRLLDRLRSPKKLVQYGRVEKLFVYPIKSCTGLEVTAAFCSKTGLQCSDLVKDRYFTIVIQSKESGEPCQVLTQRMCPRMALIKIQVSSSDENGKASMRMTAPDMPAFEIELPFDHKALNETDEVIFARLWGDDIYGKYCGSNAAKWLQIFLGRDDIMLMHSADEKHLKTLRADLAQVKAKLQPTDQTAYADWAPLLLINDTSVEYLNDKIVNELATDEEKKAFRPVTFLNFRPNILIRTPEAFDEDKFDRIYIVPDGVDLDNNDTTRIVQSASVSFRAIKPCTRCVLTTVDYLKGEKRADGEPLKTLKTFRMATEQGFENSPLFGINGAPDKFGNIKIGDKVYASLVEM